MRCSNCLSHDIEIRSGKGVCLSCGAELDLRFEDGTSALRPKQGMFSGLRLISVPVAALIAALVFCAVAMAYWLIVSSRDFSEPHVLANSEVTRQDIESSLLNDFGAGELVAALSVGKAEQVLFQSVLQEQNFPLLVQFEDEAVARSNLYVLQGRESLHKQELPQGVKPQAAAGLPDGGFILAHVSGGDLVITRINNDGDQVWRRPIFLDGLALDRVKISVMENTILIETSMQETAKTIHYLLSSEGRLSSLHTYEGSDIPAAILLPDESIITTNLLPTSDPGQKVWNVTRKNPDGRVVWKTELPDIGSENYSEMIVSESQLTYVLSSKAKKLVKLASNGALEWQRDFDLPYDGEVYDLFATPNNGVVIVSLGKTARRKSVLNSVAFTSQGVRSSPAVFDFDLEINAGRFLDSADGEFYLTGHGALKRVGADASAFVIKLNPAKLIPGDRLSSQTSDAVPAPIIPATPSIRRLEPEVEVEQTNSPAIFEAEVDVGSTETEESAIDWQNYPYAECRFVCVDKNEIAILMGQTVATSGSELGPVLSNIHKEICGLASAVPDTEQAPICQPVS